MKAKRRYEEQGIGEQGEKNWERGERNERWKFFQSGQKGDHEKSSYEEGLTRWKKDARIKIVKNTRRFFCLNNEVNKVEDSPKKKPKSRIKTKKQKNMEVHQKQSSKKRGDIFSNVREMKNRWYKNFTQKEMCDTIRIFKTFFENQGIFFFQKRTKKESQNKRHTRQNEGFFFLLKKVEKTKKKLEMRKLTKKLRKTIATIRKDKRNKTKCAHQKN